jgi:hypothetical protein
MDRRRFLKLAGLSSVAVTVGSATYRVGHWWLEPAADDFEVLSASEVRIARAIAGAIFPGEEASEVEEGRPLPDGSELEGVVAYLDRYLDTIADDLSRMLRLSMHAIEDAALFRDWSFTPFHARPRSERIAILRAWDESNLIVRRKAFRALKMIVAGGYCRQDRVREAAGIQFLCGG